MTTITKERADEARDDTFRECLEFHLAQLDAHLATVRAYAADPGHVNRESKEMKDVQGNLNDAMGRIFRLKDAWETFRVLRGRQEREAGANVERA